MRKEFKLHDPFESELHVYLWETSVSKPKGVVLIIHGKGEHCGRYDDFAQFLTKNGFHVICNDHRGHGKTLKTDEDSVYFDKNLGFHKVYEGVKTVRDYVEEHYSHLPVIMFAHSMGSFIGRYALMYDKDRYRAAIFSGTGFFSGISLFIGKLLTNTIVLLKGDHYVSNWLNNKVFDGHIRSMKKKGIINKREDWISQDPQIVRNVKNDPLCNLPFTIGAQRDLLQFIPEVQNTKKIKESASSTAIYFISGDLDGFGKYGESIKKLYNIYRDCGYSNVKYTVLNNTRHEVINDIEKIGTYALILEWINKNL
jgi:alpha-beta hydrolase superfamily lysophospholipase